MENDTLVVYKGDFYEFKSIEDFKFYIKLDGGDNDIYKFKKNPIDSRNLFENQDTFLKVTDMAMKYSGIYILTK